MGQWPGPVPLPPSGSPLHVHAPALENGTVPLKAFPEGVVSPNRRKFRRGSIMAWRVDEGLAC
jgi:hypothetical protein